MAYGESNGHLTDDVTWPQVVKLVTPIRLEPNILKTPGVCYLAAIAIYSAVTQYGRLS